MKEKIIIAVFLVIGFATAGYLFFNNTRATGTMDVHGTEYMTGQPAKTFLQLLDEKKMPVNKAQCSLTIFYPDGKPFVFNAKMIEDESGLGLYYYDFVTPNTIGVYMVSTLCNTEGGTIHGSGEVHIYGTDSQEKSSNSDISEQIKEMAFSIKVFGTEYIYGQVAKPFLQLLDSDRQPLNLSTCYMSVLYPNQTALINNAMMSQQSSLAFHYYDFVVPNVTGVYMVSARCFYNTTLQQHQPQSFHAYSASGIIGDYVMAQYLDAVTHTYSTSGSVLNVTYNFTGITDANGTSLVFYWSGYASQNTVLSMYAWNFNTSSWTLLPNTATGIGSSTSAGSSEISMSNTITTNWQNYIGSGQAIMMLYATGNGKIIETDLVFVGHVGQVSPYINELRGSGEVHVSKPIENVTVDVSGDVRGVIVS